MGWDTWNRFGCGSGANETKIRAVADAMVANGMLAAGYEYVIVDDCWQGPRQADGTPAPDPTKFPSGMASLGSYLSARGLTLGIQSIAAPTSCVGRTGSEGYESIDVQTFASWGAKYLKYSRCGTTAGAEADFRAMRTALDTFAPDFVYSVHDNALVEWMTTLAQLWRTTTPVSATWDSIGSILDVNAGLAAFARPGAFNDPDMLEVGNAGLSESEMRAQFTLWAVMTAPLIAGNDPTEMSATADAILTNSEIIAIDQDPLGLQGIRVRDDGDTEVYAKPLAGCGARGVVLLNRGAAPAAITVSWPEIWLGPGSATVRDLWARADQPPAADHVTVTVAPHDVAALKIIGTEPSRPRGGVYLGDAPWTYAANGLGPVERNQSNGDAASNDGTSLTIRGATYAKGLGVHGPSLVRYRLGRACTRFTADVGIDDASASGTVSFQVWADGEKLLDTGVLSSATPIRHVDLDVTNRHELRLFVGDGDDGSTGDLADWADAHVDCAP
jgi:alpha-galactosidase